MLLLSTFTSVCFFKSRAEYMASLHQLNSGLYSVKYCIIPSDVHSSRGAFFFFVRSISASRSSILAAHVVSLLLWVASSFDSSTVSLQPPSKALSSILGKSNLQFAGMSINLNISTSSLNLMTPDGKQVSAHQGLCTKQTEYDILLWL